MKILPLLLFISLALMLQYSSGTLQAQARPAPLQIISATWGSSTIKADVTAKVQSLIKNGELNFTADVATFGDPAPGVAKELNLVFQLNGQRYVQKMKERDSVSITKNNNPAPEGPVPVTRIPIPRPPATPSITDIPVPSATPPATTAPAAAPADPAIVERPEFRTRPKPLVKSLASVTAMMVQRTGDGELLGLTSDIIATVPAESRRSEKAGIGFFRADGDTTMKTALEEAVRAVTLRYPLWEPGHIDLSFGEKFVKHGGPSAGAAFGTLMLSILEGFEIDPKCALTGDITVDWKVRKVGGVTAKIRGAALDNCLLAAIPDGNATALTDMSVLYGTSSLYSIQVFSIATLQDAVAIARKDRAPKLAEAIKLFDGLKPELAKADRTALARPETQKSLKRILELAPNHLSAKNLLDVAEGKAARSLSANASLYRIDAILQPYYRLMATEQRINRTTLAVATTINARKQINLLRPMANKDILPLIIDASGFIEAVDQFAEKPTPNAQQNVMNRAKALDARFEQIASDKDLRATLRREGY